MAKEINMNDLNQVAGGKAEDNKYYTVTAGGWVPYRLKDGDTLGNLAKVRGTTAAHILTANPLISNPDEIFAGYWILLPAID